MSTTTCFHGDIRKIPTIFGWKKKCFNINIVKSALSELCIFFNFQRNSQQKQLFRVPSIWCMISKWGEILFSVRKTNLPLALRQHMLVDYFSIQVSFFFWFFQITYSLFCMFLKYLDRNAWANRADLIKLFLKVWSGSTIQSTLFRYITRQSNN